MHRKMYILILVILTIINSYKSVSVSSQSDDVIEFENSFLSLCSCDDVDLNCHFFKENRERLQALIDIMISKKLACVATDAKSNTYVPKFIKHSRSNKADSSGGANSSRGTNSTSSSSSSSSSSSKTSESKKNTVSTQTPSITSANISNSNGIAGNYCIMDDLSFRCIKTGIDYYYPTAILTKSLLQTDADTKSNQELKELLLALEEENDGCTANLHGGYRSKDGFLKRKEDSIAWLNSRVLAFVTLLLNESGNANLGISIDGWGAVLRSGDAQNIHLHPGSIFAGVYYVAAPPGLGENRSHDGCLRFSDPRPAAQMAQAARSTSLYGSNTEICPNESGGLLVIFPSYLMHEVKPMRENQKGPRIAISFNVIARP